MLVSVIVPVYNVEKYLRQCLDSLLAQTHKELEVIMIDDGSKDSSGAICDEYALKYDNFIVIHKKNAGLGMARNTGLDNITGEYVTFVDSDDYLTPLCVEILYNNVVEYNVHMCKSGFQRVRDNGEIVAVRRYKNEVFEGSDARTQFLPRLIGSSPSQHDSVEMCVNGAIYKTAPIIENNLRFPSEREFISEDMIFNIDYMQYSDGVCITEDIGYNYRINMSSLTKSYRKDRFTASRYFYIEVKKKLENLGYSSETILRLKRMFFIYLRTCIAQERRTVSGHNVRQATSNIRLICNDNIVKHVIKEYPVRYLGFKQRVFVELMRYKLVAVLYILAVLRKL